MRCPLSGVAAAAVALAMLTHGRAPAQSLPAGMAQYGHLVGGTWSCVTRVPATPASPAHQDRSTAVFEVVAGGVVHDHIVAADYSGDFYIGYDDRSGKYWMTGADSLGTNLSLTSSDGLHYTGTSSMGGLVMNDQATYGRDGPNRTEAHEVFTRPGVQATFDTVCTRAGP